MFDKKRRVEIVDFDGRKLIITEDGEAKIFGEITNFSSLSVNKEILVQLKMLVAQQNEIHDLKITEKDIDGS